MQQIGEISTLPTKAAIYEESNKNYITLLDLDEQNNLRSSKETVLKADSIINRPPLAVPSTPPATSLLTNRIRLYDLLPFKVYNPALVPYDKRLEPFLTLDTGNNKSKQTEPIKSETQPVITDKDGRTLKQHRRCPACHGLDCFCIIQGLINPSGPGSSMPTMIKNAGRDLQMPDNPEFLQFPSFVSQKGDLFNDKVSNPGSSNRKRKAPQKSKTEKGTKASGLKTKSSERTCTKCGLVFASHREVLLHSRVHVTENKKEFGCHLCGKYFSQRTTLRQHLILHSGEKNFACTECGKRFALKIYLKTHQKSCGSR
ncbi:zinc finger protein 835-like [Bolinopsis microptera]|uniref:zinc finger protein 835-like n=1 Tax=Bolinopsis microptera TaxID=2820187 RepID=UPI00307ACEE0